MAESLSMFEFSKPEVQEYDDAEVTDKDILDVASSASGSWLKIARRLPRVDEPGLLAFSLDDRRLSQVAKAFDDDEERLIAVLQQWRGMSISHTWFPLWDTLKECGFGKLAGTIRHKRKPSTLFPSSPATLRVDSERDSCKGDELHSAENKIIKRNLTFLINHLNLSDIIDYLLEQDVISSDDYFEVIRLLENPHDGRETAARYYVRKLLKMPAGQVERFIMCLECRKDLRSIAERMKTEEGSRSQRMDHSRRVRFQVSESASSNTEQHLPQLPVTQSLKLTSKAEFAGYAYAEQISCWALVSIQAPTDLGGHRAPLNLVFIVDRSGSMAGQKMFMVKKTLQFIVSEMGSSDRLGLVLFDDEVTAPFPHLIPMDKRGKERMFYEIQQIAPDGGTNLSGGLVKGLQMVEDLQETSANSKSDISAVLLMTDGQANVGYSNEDDIILCLTRTGRQILHNRAFHRFSPGSHEDTSAMEASRSTSVSANVHTFGFGVIHNDGLLQSLSRAANGMYYFIDSAEKIPQSFADCLGGLLSTVAQDISVELTTSNGVTIESVVSGRDKKLSASGTSCTLPLGDIQSEERRDIVLRLSLPSVDQEQTEWPVLHAGLSCFNVLTQSTEMEEVQLNVSRPSITPKSCKSDCDVALHRSRVDSTSALKKAISQADQGNMKEARLVVEKAISNLHAVEDQSNPIHGQLVHEMGMCLEKMETTIWSAGGRQTMRTISEMHQQQRSSSEGSSYSTRARANTMESYRSIAPMYQSRPRANTGTY